MLYERYSNPMDLVKMYINQRRFGAFVESFLKEEYERRKQEAKKEEEMKLWIAYVHSCVHGFTDKNYDEWKKQIYQSGSTTPTGKSDADLNDDGIQAIFDDLFS